MLRGSRTRRVTRQLGGVLTNARVLVASGRESVVVVDTASQAGRMFSRVARTSEAQRVGGPVRGLERRTGVGMMQRGQRTGQVVHRCYSGQSGGAGKAASVSEGLGAPLFGAALGFAGAYAVTNWTSDNGQGRASDVQARDENEEQENSEPTHPLYSVFCEFASVNRGGVWMMTPEDFIQSLLPDEEGSANEIDAANFIALFRLADRTHTGLISFQEYLLFATIMSKPESEFEIAFRLFDSDNDGKIQKAEFERMLKSSGAGGHFDLDSDFMKRFFGADGTGSLSYAEFIELLSSLRAEIIRQEFQYYDKEGKGVITAQDFVKILTFVEGSRLPAYIRANLNKVHDGTISYAQFLAFENMLRKVDDLDQALRIYCPSNDCIISKQDFTSIVRASTGQTLSPMEVDIIFRLFDVHRNDTLDVEHFLSVMKKRAMRNVTDRALPKGPSEQNPAAGGENTVLDYAIASAQHFVLGAIAGGIGAFAVYPIDLVKTRMQNQRSVAGKKKMYENSLDCFRKTLRAEGVVGLYRGLGPQLVGVAPEKAIKLTMNDLLRSLFSDDGETIYFPLEILAGAGAGASQVVFTNPLEIIKIRLQVQGEAIKAAQEAGRELVPKSAVNIIKELGFMGLYKGAAACLLRDVPFSGIYFPGYAKLKEKFTDEDGATSPQNLLLAGAAAGMPAASLTTPADVIKTRLQVEAREGEKAYSGIRDAARHIYKDEGLSAFFKGSAARVFRSSPQFGVTLLSYELLHMLLFPDMDKRPPTNAPVTGVDYQRMHRDLVAQRMQNVTRNLNTLGFATTVPEEQQLEEHEGGKGVGVGPGGLRNVGGASLRGEGTKRTGMGDYTTPVGAVGEDEDDEMD